MPFINQMLNSISILALNKRDEALLKMHALPLTTQSKSKSSTA